MTLRKRDYVIEAKKMTYAQARDKILDVLEQHGWTVKRGLKIPHATKDDVKLWFKTQALYVANSSLSFGSARSMHFDTKKLAEIEPTKLANGLYKHAKKQADALASYR